MYTGCMNVFLTFIFIYLHAIPIKLILYSKIYACVKAHSSVTIEIRFNQTRPVYKTVSRLPYVVYCATQLNNLSITNTS